MYCDKCGNELSNGIKFCEKCGNKIIVQSAIINSNLDKSVVRERNSIIPKLNVLELVGSISIAIAIILFVFPYFSGAMVFEQWARQYNTRSYMSTYYMLGAVPIAIVILLFFIKRNNRRMSIEGSLVMLAFSIFVLIFEQSTQSSAMSSVSGLLMYLVSKNYAVDIELRILFSVIGVVLLVCAYLTKKKNLK